MKQIFEGFNMEVVTFSLLSAFAVQIFCLVSYIFYKRYKTLPAAELKTPVKLEEKSKKQVKQNSKKEKAKNSKKMKQKVSKPDLEDSSDTGNYTMENQMAQIIMKEQHSDYRINMTAVNEKPSIKKHNRIKISKSSSRSSSKQRHNSVNELDLDDDMDWASVTNRRHKLKIEVTNPSEYVFKFTLDVEGGIVELPFCEIHFPPESVTGPMEIRLEVERNKKIVDESGEKILLTPSLLFSPLGNAQLKRRFTLKITTMKIMGRGWEGNVCGQIETSKSDDWTVFGRTEYQFGKPVQIVHDTLTNFRVVVTRMQNGTITRHLKVAAYLSRSKSQDPDNHVLALCAYDQSSQTRDRVESLMQNYILKMPPRECDVSFGSDLHFEIPPTQKFSAEDKEVFMRWTEICKATVFVKFQIRLTKNDLERSSYEAEYRTLVTLNILKVKSSIKTSQLEYFHFYWISDKGFSKRGRKKRPNKAIKRKEGQISEDDGFASGTEPNIDVQKSQKSDILPKNLAIQAPSTPNPLFQFPNKRKPRKTKEHGDGDNNEKKTNPSTLLPPTGTLQGHKTTAKGGPVLKKDNKPNQPPKNAPKVVKTPTGGNILPKRTPKETGPREKKVYPDNTVKTPPAQQKPKIPKESNTLSKGTVPDNAAAKKPIQPYRNGPRRSRFDKKISIENNDQPKTPEQSKTSGLQNAGPAEQPVPKKSYLLNKQASVARQNTPSKDSKPNMGPNQNKREPERTEKREFKPGFGKQPVKDVKSSNIGQNYQNRNSGIPRKNPESRTFYRSQNQSENASYNKSSYRNQNGIKNSTRGPQNEGVGANSAPKTTNGPVVSKRSNPAPVKPVPNGTIKRDNRNIKPLSNQSQPPQRISKTQDSKMPPKSTQEERKRPTYSSQKDQNTSQAPTTHSAGVAPQERRQPRQRNRRREGNESSRNSAIVKRMNLQL